jgi:hypothetical protein
MAQQMLDAKRAQTSLSPVQKIIYYHHQNDIAPQPTSFHLFLDLYPNLISNKTSYMINPNEDIIIALANYSSYWFYHEPLFEINYKNKEFFMNNNVQKQVCIWIKNVSDSISMFVEENTPLSLVLYQPEIIFRVCIISKEELSTAAIHFFVAPTPPSTPAIQNQTVTSSTVITLDDIDEEDDDKEGEIKEEDMSEINENSHNDDDEDLVEKLFNVRIIKA